MLLSLLLLFTIMMPSMFETLYLKACVFVYSLLTENTCHQLENDLLIETRKSYHLCFLFSDSKQNLLIKRVHTNSYARIKCFVTLLCSCFCFTVISERSEIYPGFLWQISLAQKWSYRTFVISGSITRWKHSVKISNRAKLTKKGNGEY